MALHSVTPRALQTLARGLVQIFYPNLCWVCRQPIPPDQHAFCPSCRETLFTDPRPSCPRCAATVGPYAALEAGCPECLSQNYAFDGAVRVGPYQGPLRDVILRTKHVHAEGLAELVASAWAEAVADKLRALGIQLVVPVPLHWWRRLRRGYNQCDALARAHAKILQVPCYPFGLRRLRKTAMQAALPVPQRRDNVRDAFEARRSLPVRNKKALLVDDVMTTGSTAHEAARALRRAGAEQVIVAVLARAEL